MTTDKATGFVNIDPGALMRDLLASARKSLSSYTYSTISCHLIIDNRLILQNLTGQYDNQTRVLPSLLSRITRSYWLIVIVAIIMTWFLPAALATQRPTPPAISTSTPQHTKYSNTVYREVDGLPQSSIKTVDQTRDGYIWVGTQEGLCRFDGRYFKTFTTSTTPGLPSQNIHNIVVDAAGTLWIHTGNNIVAYSHGTFTDWTPHWSTSSGDRIRSIQRGFDGSVYCQTDHWIYRCEAKGISRVADLYA